MFANQNINTLIIIDALVLLYVYYLSSNG